MKKIPLTRGKVALVDDKDYEWLSKWRWRAMSPNGRCWYACRTVWAHGRSGILLLHRLILNAPHSKRTDHKNGNGLDNRRKNLRLATVMQNIANSRQRVRAGRFRGVSWRDHASKWCAHIQVKGKSIHLGYFKKERDAATAYDAAALQHFGEFASTNFGPQKERRRRASA